VIFLELRGGRDVRGNSVMHAVRSDFRSTLRTVDEIAHEQPVQPASQPEPEYSERFICAAASSGSLSTVNLIGSLPPDYSERGGCSSIGIVFDGGSADVRAFLVSKLTATVFGRVLELAAVQGAVRTRSPQCATDQSQRRPQH
jgi:hypothetical protein